MNPAYSVIFFSSASGAGYGLLTWLAVARLFGLWELDNKIGFATCLVALALVTAGLLSSTFHLGHPERSWRAISQWRSSWLSREGVAAILSYPPALLFTAGWWLEWMPGWLMTISAIATALLSMATVACTGMIYAALKPVPRWHNIWVVPVYLAFALASGGLIILVPLSLSTSANLATLEGLLLVILFAWLLKWVYWRHIDTAKPSSTSGTATGLGRFGEVTQLEAPHTSDNFVLKEMGFVVARKHAVRLRKIALRMGAMIPAILVLLATIPTGIIQTAILMFAVFCGLTGILIERWLFFAEARHAVTLFYGTSQV
jgi:DMSO reductase anchor subunit